MSRTRLAPGTQRLAGWGLRGIRARTSWPGSTRLSLQCWNNCWNRHEDQSFCPFEKTEWRLCLSRTCLLCFFCSLPRKLFSAMVSMLNDAPKGGPRELSGASPLSLPHPAAPPRASPASCRPWRASRAPPPLCGGNSRPRTARRERASQSCTTTCPDPVGWCYNLSQKWIHIHIYITYIQMYTGTYIGSGEAKHCSEYVYVYYLCYLCSCIAI